MGVTEPTIPHVRHDELLVVAHVTGDLAGPADRRAQAQVDACVECARLAADVRAIRAETAALPRPRRSRDFRLDPEVAAQLRPTGWRAVVAWLASPRLSFAAPVGTALAALGLVGLLVGAGPSTSVTTSEPMLAPAAAPAAGSAPAAEPVPADAAMEAAPVAPSGTTAAPMPLAADSAAPSADGGATSRASSVPPSGAPESPTQPDPLVVGSALLLVGGLLLVAARVGSRRLTRSTLRRSPPAR